jgi:hypothetical protein
MRITSLVHSKSLLVTLVALFLFLLAIQFARPALTNSPVTAELDMPPPVKQIFTTACYNCHSNETHLSWFDQIVPAYWIVVQDVRKARSHLNFSDISALPKTQQQEVLYELVNHIQMGEMPPRSYQLLHRESKITPEQLMVLKHYLDPYGLHAAGDPAEGAAANVEYAKWIQAGDKPAAARVAPNGIAFMPQYKDWKTISTTERLDNQSIRLVLGNDIAIKAIEANQINPWPDGTIFAKVAWNRLADGQGEVHTGQFKQVEFMIKDSRKYASTLGWGFARWRGADLQPFGKDANFAKGCVGCHNPMRNNDFVFTTPITIGK